MTPYVIRENSLSFLSDPELRREGDWEADVSVSPVPVMTRAGLRLPTLAMVVEARSGFVFCAQVFAAGEPEAQALGDALIEGMRRYRQVPAVVAVRPGFDQALAPLGAALGARVAVRSAMGSLVRARDSLMSAMERSPR